MLITNQKQKYISGNIHDHVITTRNSRQPYSTYCHIFITLSDPRVFFLGVRVCAHVCVCVRARVKVYSFKHVPANRSGALRQPKQGQDYEFLKTITQKIRAI